jgi:hypothetical protein
MANLGPLPRGTTLRIIRVALLTGVLLFGGITYYLLRQGGGSVAQADADVRRTMLWVNVILLVIAAVGIMIVQRRHAAERDPARRATLNIVGWAMAEAVAMFGGVHFLLVGDATPFVVGLGMMLATFVVVPIRE